MIETLEIKVNDKYSFSIYQESRTILFKNYKDVCDMTINYPDNWAYSRALQHSLSIVNCLIEGKIV